MNKIRNKILVKIICCVFLFILSAFVAAVVSNIMVTVLTNQPQYAIEINFFFDSIAVDSRHRTLFLLLTAICTFVSISALFLKPSGKHIKTDTVKLTPNIEIPAPAGQGQYGTARFATEAEQTKQYAAIKIEKSNPIIRMLINEGKEDYKAVYTKEVREVPIAKSISPIINYSGIPISYKKTADGDEHVNIISGDVHTICYGMTRSGKTRTLVIQSICIQALAGTDMLNSDPKGELYQYTNLFLKRLGYKDFPLDFKNPKKSIHYNFLQFIIDAVEKSDISRAIKLSWDFVESIVPDNRNSSIDPLWSNGEKGIIAAAVIMLIYDNSTIGLSKQNPGMSSDEIRKLYNEKHKWYQNCVNLYHFISKMSVTNKETGNLLLEDIVNNLSYDHPAKLTLAIAESAPPKTRGSFITSALATLRLFTDPAIADITSYTDEDILNPDLKKAIFIILPDAVKTYYPLASIFTNQYYQFLADTADERGGRLKRDFKFNLDEFGNFTKIPFYDGKMTVGAGRGIHICMYLQSQAQLVEKYNREMSTIILDNCHYLIYLKANSAETLEMLSKKLGKYTVMSTSASSSVNENGIINTKFSGSSSSSTQLSGRSLLYANEIERIDRPYLLTLTDGLPSLTAMPDLHKWYFNIMLGLGSKEHNTRLRELREKSRPEHKIEPFKLWDFLKYTNEILIPANRAEIGDVISNNLLDEIKNNFFE